MYVTYNQCVNILYLPEQEIIFKNGITFVAFLD
jgi:hypothetical protein